MRSSHEMKLKKWRFHSLASGYEHADTLWLYPEINCSSCVGDLHLSDGNDQLDYFVDYIKRRYPDWWKRDAVSIYWAIRGEHTCEHSDAFLERFSWPVSVSDGVRVNWWQLPVRNDRFPAFAKALGWLPSPFQSFAPIRSIYGGVRPPKMRREND